jgi:hypothetical protein
MAKKYLSKRQVKARLHLDTYSFSKFLGSGLVSSEQVGVSRKGDPVVMFLERNVDDFLLREGIPDISNVQKWMSKKIACRFCNMPPRQIQRAVKADKLKEYLHLGIQPYYKREDLEILKSKYKFKPKATASAEQKIVDAGYVTLKMARVKLDCTRHYLDLIRKAGKLKSKNLEGYEVLFAEDLNRYMLKHNYQVRNNPDWLQLKEAASLLGCTQNEVSTLYKGLERVKSGRSWYYNAGQLKEIVAIQDLL